MQDKNTKSFVDPEMTKRLVNAIDCNFKPNFVNYP